MKGSKTHVTKRVGKGQRWGTIGIERGVSISTWVSRDRAELVRTKALGMGMTKSMYIDHLIAQDQGDGYVAS